MPEGSFKRLQLPHAAQRLRITHTFSEGENIIEFTPEKTGTVPYTCWMGMIRGNIFVTDGTGETPEVSDTQPDTGISGFGGSGMGCCGGGF